MITLTVDNSYSQLSGLSIPQFKEVRNLLSYSIDASIAHFSGNYYNTTRYLIDKKGNFPTGLLYLVIDWLCKNKIDHHLRDNRVKPRASQIVLKSIYKDSMPPPYPEQLEAVKRALTTQRGILSLPTGTGKSLIIALLCKAFGVRTLVVVPTLELKRQLTETLRSYFGNNTTGELTKSESSWIAVENVDALDPKVPLKRTDMVIIDEFHHSAAKTYRELNKHAWGKIYYRFGMTATPFRTDDNERLLLESVLSEVIYQLDYKTAVERGYIVPVIASYIELPKTTIKGNAWASVYSQLVVNNVPRNEIIAEILVKLHVNNISTLCLVKEIKHGENILKESYGISSQYKLPWVNGQDNESRSFIEEFNNRVFPVLVGTTGVLGEGIDTKPAEVVIIAGLGKAKGQFMQAVGRGVRKYPSKTECHVIIFKDPSHKFTMRHFKEQCKILLEQYGVKPTKLVL